MGSEVPDDSIGRVLRAGNMLGLDELNQALCRAVGLNPDNVQGFRLDVRGGQVPELVIYAISPGRNMMLTNDWAMGLDQLFTKLKAEERCGFNDCDHMFSQHRMIPGNVTEGLDINQVAWPCQADGCECEDYAIPGSVMDVGDISDN